MSSPTRVVLGLLGTTLDGGKTPLRWESWRPTVALCQHEDLVVDRLELLHQRSHGGTAETLRADLSAVSPETEVRLHEIELRDAWDFEEVYGVLQDFARAYPFDPEREEYLLHITTGTHVCQICMFLLAEARYFPAGLLQTAPPNRKRQGGPGSYRIIDLDLSRYDAIARRFAREHDEGLSFLKAGIDTRNAAFNRLIERIEKVAIASRAPILLTGPTGAGKSRLARRIYELKKQRRQVTGPFVEVNCATIRGDGAMSALFGHKRGSFTGALQDRSGLLRAADAGILFLDEIGELGLDEQAMLLRAVEEKRFLPVGSDTEVESDFQLIAGTNRSLADEVRSGRFRADLLSRIDLWTFRLPGLAERREDIEPNLTYELEQIAARTGTNVTFNKEARQRFLAFAVAPESAWAANFRDLNAAVTRMATLAPGGRISVEVVDEEIARLRAAWRQPADGGDEDLLTAILGPERTADLDLFDRVQLTHAIRVCRASRSLAEAGRKLFAVSRQKKKVANDADRIRKYLASHGLEWAQVRGE
ncbi:MAG TPA: RNA repair transcriptional activator RtcR [Thermoanaerobaculia bacterium]|jgi:transcriptional regulatory protein RtcR|nr:RNA repair transcriptional activator RtcR [Thermoanaerobaculia bacterium]